MLAEARAILLRLARTPGKPLVSPSATREYLTTLLALEERELFLMLALDSRHRIVASEILFAGTVDGASVHPREVVKCALRHNATAVILSHNHPSGVAEPSQADEIITTTSSRRAGAGRHPRPGSLHRRRGQQLLARRTRPVIGRARGGEALRFLSPNLGANRRNPKIRGRACLVSFSVSRRARRQGRVRGRTRRLRRSGDP